MTYNIEVFNAKSGWDWEHPCFKIVDNEGRIYHHLQKKWRKKPLKDDRYYRYESEQSAKYQIKIFEGIGELTQLLEPIYEEFHIDNIMESLVEITGEYDFIAEFLQFNGYTVIPPTNIIQQDRINDFLTTLDF